MSRLPPKILRYRCKSTWKFIKIYEDKDKNKKKVFICNKKSTNTTHMQREP